MLEWFVSRFPPHLYSSYIRNVALCDFLTRKFCEAISRGGIWGSDEGSHQGGWHDSKVRPFVFYTLERQQMIVFFRRIVLIAAG